MDEERSAPTAAISPRAAEDDPVSGFQAERNDVLRRLVRTLPWVCLVLAVAVLMTGRTYSLVPPRDRVIAFGHVMFASGLVASAASMLVFQILMARLPEALRLIWRRGVVAGADHAPPAVLEKRYRGFVSAFARWLNFPAQWAAAALFALLPATWLSREGPTPHTLLSPHFLGEAVIAAVIGTMGWKMAVTGFGVWQLGRTFVLEPKFTHPDRAGGLAPLGDLCLLNALIIGVAGAHVGGWILVANGPKTEFQAIAQEYLGVFPQLLAIPLALSTLALVLPLWSVHQEMVDRRAAVLARMEDLGVLINGLSDRLLSGADSLKPQEREAMAGELARLQQLFQENRRIPSWPITTPMLLRFGAAQVVPLLGLTGLGEPLVKVVDGMVRFFAGEVA